MQNIARNCRNTVVNRCNFNPRNPPITVGGNDRMALQNFNTSVPRGSDQRAFCVVAKIGKHHISASMAKVKKDR